MVQVYLCMQEHSQKAKVLHGKKGSGMYYYEGSDTTAYDLPYPNVFVCSFYSNESHRSRGIAFALKWENSISPTIWTNSCHDDAGTGKWNGWNAIS